MTAAENVSSATGLNGKNGLIDWKRLKIQAKGITQPEY